MKIVYLTAGAAGMFCGSCMLDNSLARAMNRLGHDCMLVPVYTPIRTDEENVSLDRVFFGGVNVYLQQKFPFLAYLPRWLDASLNNPALIRRLTSKAGETSPKLLGALSVSMLRGTQGRQRKEVIRMCDWLQASIKPDAILLTNLLIGGCIPELKKRFPSKIFVTLQGDDIFLDMLPEPYRERSITAMKQLVPLVDKFIVHSHDYGRRMASLLSIPDHQIACVPAAIDTSDFLRRYSTPRSTNPSEDKSLTIGYFARMAPEKGLDLIVDAFIALSKQASSSSVASKNRRNPSVRLKMAGWMGSQHTSFWEEQKRKLDQAGLHERWEYCGSIDRAAKVEFFRGIDLLCVPTSYQEPKGLFVLESVAAGVPYVQPSHGAFPELHHRLNAIDLDDPSSDVPIDPNRFGRLFKPHQLEDLIRALSETLDSVSDAPMQIKEISKVHQEIGIDRMASRLLEVIDT
ncbi:MAG: glycosyltransferase family 4 protein [Planctomycetota bacterium]|nr:glycosyltransferase family 4 protein [Planctomycetota bacterium]